MATKTRSDDDTRGPGVSGSHAAHEAGTDATAGTAVVSERTPEERAQMAANSIGAQIILDYNEDGSLGARGGAGGTIEENSAARDAHLIALGLDPNAPSGPPLTQEQLAAKRKREEELAASPLFLPASGKATRVSSLAAGISADDLPDPPAGSVTGAASSTTKPS